MPHLLTRLKIHEVSSVDRGAGKGVKVVLMKREPIAGEDYLPFDDAVVKSLEGGVVEYLKRQFSQAERDADAKSGAAMPGGGFPIKNGSDLSNAIQAVGRAKNPAAAKAHIKERARALGLSDKIPDSWGKADMRDRAEILQDVISVGALALPLGADSGAINKAATNMSKVLKSGTDETVEKSLNQYVEHVAGLVPTDKRDAFLAAVAADSNLGKGDDMDPKELAKMIDAAVAKALEPFKPLTAQVAKLETENAVLKMTPEHRDAFGRMEKAEDQDKFLKADAKGRDELAKAFPPKKNGKSDQDEDDVDKRIAKAFETSPVFKGLQDTITKQADVIKTLTGTSETASFAKRATDLGLPEAAGETMRKAYAGDAKAQGELDQLIKGLATQTDTSVLFAEFGKAQDGKGTGTTAYQEIRTKAADLQKTAEGKGLSIHQAINKVMSDPANAELIARNKREENTRRGRAAAA